MRVTSLMPAKSKAKSSRTPAKPLQRDRRSRALQEIGATLIAGGKGPGVVEEIAQLVQRTCKYRWVGVYKIKRDDFVIEAATNKMKPACPRFPVTQGLSAKAAEERRTVNVPDVHKEPCFLPNFWSTKSEIVVPIIDDEHDRVVGVINVESAKAHAFGKSDRDFLEGVARIIWRAFR
jgi:putative methionine-R-sulfoxide reductase with GAF domain